jgi:hypothetical protein
MRGSNLIYGADGGGGGGKFIKYKHNSINDIIKVYSYTVSFCNMFRL